MKTREDWIDIIKAICIICVYIAHSEGFTGIHTILGKFVYPFYVNAFFFTSGYLLYKKFLYNNAISNYSLTTLKDGILNCIYRLAIPTIIFSTIIYLPKILFHKKQFDIAVFATEILGGTSFWFTSALFVAQILILTLFLTKKKNLLFYLILTAIIFLVLQIICDFTTKPSIAYFPWYYRTGLIYTFIMTIGGAFAMYQEKINKWTIILPAIISTIGYYLIFTGYSIACLGLSGRCNIMGFFTSISATIILIEITKHLKAVPILIFIGKNSIIFYFLSGAMPAFLSTILAKMAIEGTYLLSASVLLSLICSYITTYIITKNFSFLTDIRLIYKNDHRKV